MMQFLTDYENNKGEQIDMLKDFTLGVGLERYQEFVVNYNQNIHDAIAQGIYPTNEERLAAGCIELKSDKKTL